MNVSLLRHISRYIDGIFLKSIIPLIGDLMKPKDPRKIL